MAADTHQLAWAAGIIDGEGCISICRKRHANAWVLRVTVSQVDPRLPARLKELFGGSVSHYNPVKKNHRRVWTWTIQAHAAEAALRAVLPWLFLKKEQAEIGMASRQFIKKAEGRVGALRSPAFSEAQIDAQEWLRRQLSDLKWRAHV